MNLKEISRKYKTDKENEHEYLETYEKHFGNTIKREDVKKVVEIGIYYGDSLLMWAEYFPNAQIIGADIIDYSATDYKLSLDGKTLIDRSDVLLNHPRIKTYVLDQTDEKSIKDFKFNIGNDCDILIDDGGHSMEMHQKTLKHLLDCVSLKGLYIIEDLHSCNTVEKELYGFSLIQEGDTLTTDLLEDLKDEQGLYPYTNYINEDEMLHIKNQIYKIEIDMCKLSEIAFIYKKWPLI
tara:strand:+ start:10130 stop:10840 length:711 start_codon:yes stop_codon:yes gene_type:complete